MSLIVKAYLEKPDKTEEIRRFALDQDVASNFDYLTKKLTKVFPGLDDNCTIFWKGKPDFILNLILPIFFFYIIKKVLKFTRG